jgi:hypothetical protein
MIENLPQLMGDHGWRERLLQMRRAFVEHAVMDDGGLGDSHSRPAGEEKSRRAR